MSRLRATVLLALALLVISCGTTEAPPDESERLREAVTPEGILEHARRLEEIAEENGGDRAAGTSGYDASAAYVAQRLRAASYDVTVQRFEFPYFLELSPPRLERVSSGERPDAPGWEFETMRYSGSGEATARVSPVDLDSPASGCAPEDFAGFPEGGVALLRRGVCSFARKAANAGAAGASATVISNEEGQRGVPTGTLGRPGVAIPVLGASFEAGEELARGATVRVSVSTISENRETANVISDTPTGRSDRTVVVGAHLDSVPEGPGINDNASGSATILEVAEEMSKLKIEPRNRVRFAFWGAEEEGLLGSEHYVEGLSEREVEGIDAYLNFDMLASPNGVRFVYDDRGNPPGSESVEEVFTGYFESQRLPAEPDDSLVGRSDHGPFAQRGVPVGGLFSGAEGTKTAQQAEVYGGEPGAPLDPCYHRACDGVENLDVRSLDEMSDAAAYATLRFAQAK